MGPVERQGTFILRLRPTFKLVRITSGGVTVILLGVVVVSADELEDLRKGSSESFNDVLSSVPLEQWISKSVLYSAQIVK